ncbi:hypothetical protein B0I29_115101 [Actinoplanes lutulentus]|uniref:Uncharacterized protein n=1 Tax=Actinoplanes lutulentus TaxID=1287878 RepID=A0A327Z5D2_9ACTN|nr:hypothetical protein B0I29_115101 [Actinoplanes lutulentus]
MVDMFQVGSAAQAAASLFNTHRQLKAAAVARAEQRAFASGEADRRFERDLALDAVRAARRHEVAELESRLRRNNELAAMKARVGLDTYPVEEGPGHLRESLQLISSDLSALPLVVLLPRAHGTAEPQWNGLRHAIIDALRRQLVSDGLVILHDAMRTLSWPHAGLYWNDLYGIPTLIVQTTFFHDKLDIGLGGCHLRPGADDAAEMIRNVYRHRLAAPRFWTREVVTEMNAGLPASHQLEVPESDADRARVNVDVAARAVAAVVTAAVDAYYLGNRLRYRARFDDAAALLGPAAPRELPLDSGVALDQVADPAFHLLQTAARLARRGDPAAAIAAVRRSLDVLVDPDHAVLDLPYSDRERIVVALAEAGSEYGAEFAAVLAVLRAADEDARFGSDITGLEALRDA